MSKNKPHTRFLRSMCGNMAVFRERRSNTHRSGNPKTTGRHHGCVLSGRYNKNKTVKRKVPPMQTAKIPSSASIVRTFTAPGRNFKTDYLRYIDTEILIFESSDFQDKKTLSSTI